MNRDEDPHLLKLYHFQYSDLKTLLNSSDIVTLHLPLTEETKHIINKGNINELKKGSYLINTARGGLVETEAILMGIDEGIIEGVGLDVLEEEEQLTEEAAVMAKEATSENLKTLVLNHALINHPKVLITPHNAFNSREALVRIDKTTIDNINSYIAGTPVNLV